MQSFLKGSYDAIIKIIILCIWCNRICWHALMFKKHIIFQILYIIVVPLCPSSLKTHVFYKAPPSTSAVCSDGQLTQCIVIGRTPQARVGNIMPLTIIASFSFQVSFTISSSPKAEQSRVTTQVMMLVCIAVHKPRLRQFLTAVHSTVMWPVPLTHSHTTWRVTRKTPRLTVNSKILKLITKHTYSGWFRSARLS